MKSDTMSWVLYEDDCFNVFPEIEDESVDMILCDLPYGTTACKWDTILPLDELWLEYKRVIKDKGAIVLTASQPFTSALVSSNYEMFKYSWIWDKKKPSSALHCNISPLKKHEDVLVFGINPNYQPIMEKAEVRTDAPRIAKNGDAFGGNSIYRQHSNHGLKYPKSIIEISNANQSNRLHPTQKPVALFEYLIKTYTNENDLVLDNCAGSGTTGVACQNLNRNCILIEKEHDYCDIIRERMATIETLQVEQRKQQTLLDYAVAK
jgi:site-specific DNA-methyltransferase (adenine-specific)